MGILNPSFAVGIIILFYLLSFVLFAIIRIATGVSIQRIGYLSFRRIAYCPREGIRIDIRGLGLRFHRPTFAQPTWISLRLNELKVTVNVKGLAQPIRGKKKEKHTRNKDAGAPQGGGTEVIEDGEDEPGQGQTDRSRTWKQLTHLKEQIKSIHGKIHWIRIFDLEVLNASCVISDVASVQLGLLSLAVDTRRKTVDRGRLFRHKKVTEGTQRPAEWLLSLKGILFTPHGRDSMEILDICSMNVHGLLYRDLEGLRDVSISLKLGRVHLPYDDIIQCQMRIQSLQSALPQRSTDHNRNVSFTAVVEELDMPHSNDDLLVQTVSDSKEFISSLLRGIQEIQMAVSSVGLSKEIQRLKPEDPSLYINLVMNEFGIDLYRLDPKSPAHRMYFSPKDIAHQALLAAISIAVSVDDGRGKPERLLYVPMATTTIKTTLPSRTLAQSEDKDAAERNANILFANSVVTSPSIDLDLRHLPIALGLLQGVPQTSQRKPASDERRHHIISRLLPKASIKFSIQEPVARLVLPPIDSTTAGPEEYDLLISAISSISMDLESSHAAAGELHYALAATLRASSYEFYYQSAHGVRHNLLLADALELKGQLAATPAVNISMFGHAETFSIHLIHPELSKGLHQVVRQVRSNPRLGKSTSSLRRKRLNFLRRLSPTITQFQFQGSNFGVQIAGVDAGVSKDVRGAAFQVESWTVDYKLRKDIPAPKRFVSQRATSGSQSGDESFQRFDQGLKYATEPPESTDGRRVAIHVKGLEGFIVEGTDACESEPFVSLPRFEVAFSTSSDQRGHIFHVNTHLKALHVQYSLYCYYALGVANFVLQSLTQLESTHEHHSEPTAPKLSNEQVGHDDELVTFDIKAAMFQVKAKMPSDPPIMLRVWGLEAGRHRWAVPFLKSRVIRMYTETPHIRSTWSKIVGIKSLRVDLRESKRKVGKDYVQEQSIDVVTDFVRIGVPHQLVVHRIFDNFVNVAKATQQLHHRFQTGTNEYILHKGPEKPKRVPHISIRSKALNFQLEDGVFDWKIGMIYRCGLVEQKQRLAREEAYHAKLKKVNENGARRGSSRFRTQSAHPTLRGRSLHPNPDRRTERSKSDGSRSRGKSPIPTEHRGRRMRYDPEAAFIPSSSAQISIDEAFDKLTQYHSQSWKSRIDQVLRFHKKTMQTIRGLYGGDEDLPEPYDDSEVILTIPHRPGLMSTLLSDIHITVGNPSFPLEGYPEFLHAMGKGIPKDMKYGLLVPMGIQINMGESRMMLRDYPLPLLHIPPLRAGQSSRLPCWSVKTDFVIAEEFRDSESIKHVKVMVVPPEKITSPPTVKNGFGIDVRRTVSPVKTYSNVDISINTANPTSITWGTSYQPAIQDMMQIIENFTKPQVDPSERCGFWDKIRLGVHSRIRVVWKGDGDVHFKLKGSRSPYVVTGYGAGFVMCFRNNVRWEIHNEDDPRKFMTVSSGEYVLAIPDYSHEARKDISTTQSDTDSISSSITNVKNNAMFKKTIMKLSGNVRWVAGLVFERDVGNGKRSFESVPHYQVTLKTPAHAKGTIDESYDAFRGFRSQHIHLSIAIIAPLDRDWSVTNSKPSPSYNSIHLTPRFFTHFFSWWSLFSGVMSLPIRQGKLFPGVEKASKKFGRHLATFKYKLLLSPLFIAHIYKHKDAEDYADDVVAATGLKLRIDSFMLDLHQRREEFNIAAGSKTKGRAARTSAMKINEVQLDLITADLRAISAIIKGTSQEEISKASDADIASYQQQSALTPDISRFTIPDNDFLWIDMDDFVEPDWILPAETHPETKIMPLAFAPRFNYFRQTDHANNISGDPSRSSPFGKEPTHFCIMSQDNDPRRVQYDLMRDRVAAIDAQIDIHRHSMGEQGLRVVRDGVQDGNLKTHQEQMASQRKILEDKRDFMYHMLQHMLKRMENKTPLHAGEEAIEISQDGSEAFPSASSTHSKDSKDMDDAISFEQDFPADFNNRFIAHNIQLKWNNSLRNVILRYVHQVSQRRGFVYYMSRRAVKFILDIVEEQMKTRHKDGETSTQRTPTSPTSSSKSFFEDDQEDDSNLEERIEQILKGENTVNVEDSHIPRISVRQDTSNMDHDIAEEFIPQNSYHVRLIAPQIQLQSEKNPKAVLLVTAKGMQLKVLQIMDKSRLQDDVSGLVQRRFSLDMEGAQFFVAHQKNLAQYLQLYSANRYGMPKGSSWPPWVPVEVNFDFQFNPAGFARVVQKTSASLRYDKYNTLRLKYNDELSRGDTTPSHAVDDPETRIDHLWVEFPQIRAACDSAQYYAMYLIVVDLLLYTEPLEKVRSERLEKIMLAADFSDLTGAPEMVISLQERIRQLEEIKAHFQLNAKYLDRQGWLDRLVIERDITGCEDELFFMMKAITTSQRKYDDRSQSSQNGLLRWYLSASDIVWHLMREKNEPLIEIQLKNATYDRTDNSDGSNNNTMEIARLHGLNLLPNTLYPEMLAPYFENSHAAQTRNDEDIKMLKVQWIMLEAIAGIPVLDQFEVNLFPLKIQLEREVGKKLFDYVFPGGPEGGASPFMIKHKMNVQDDDDDDSDGDLQLSNTSSPAMTYEEPQQSTRAGSLELRLRPTLNLSESSRPKTSTAAMREGTPSSNDSHRFKFFASGNRPNAHRSLSLNRSHTSLRPVSQRNVSHKSSDDSLRSLRRSMGDSSSTSLAGMNSAERSSRFRLNRSASSNSTLDTSSSKDTAKASDDLSQMLSRASNYMTLSYVKIPSVVLCLSYKGKGERNIEDVHDFVFRMPNLEYRNKTWSNLDLALRLKKDVIRALISHTGAIIGNKLSHHRPNKTQQSRLRQIANTSILSPNADSLTNNLSNVARRGTMRGTRSTSPIRRTGSELSTYQTSETSSSLSFGAASSGRTSNSTRSSSPNGKVSLPSRGKSFVTSSLKQFASSSRSGHISEEPDELDVPHPTSKDSASPQREQTNGDAHSTEAEHSLFGPGSLTRRLTGGAKSIGSRHRESLFAASNNLDIPPVPAVPSTFTTNGSNGRVHRGSTGDEKESRPGSEGDSNGILLHAVEKARSHNDETPSTNGTAAGYEGGKRREDEIGSNPSSGSTGLQGNRSRKASVIHLGKKILGTLN